MNLTTFYLSVVGLCIVACPDNTNVTPNKENKNTIQCSTRGYSTSYQFDSNQVTQFLFDMGKYDTTTIQENIDQGLNKYCSCNNVNEFKLLPPSTDQWQCGITRSCSGNELVKSMDSSCGLYLKHIDSLFSKLRLKRSKTVLFLYWTGYSDTLQSSIERRYNPVSLKINGLTIMSSDSIMSHTGSPISFGPYLVDQGDGKAELTASQFQKDTNLHILGDTLYLEVNLTPSGVNGVSLNAKAPKFD